MVSYNFYLFQKFKKHFCGHVVTQRAWGIYQDVVEEKNMLSSFMMALSSLLISCSNVNSGDYVKKLI